MTAFVKLMVFVALTSPCYPNILKGTKNKKKTHTKIEKKRVK